jgi:AcrR family transcriptional regulator
VTPLSTTDPLGDGPLSADALADRREGILQAAAEVFFEAGYQGASLSAVASAAGLEAEEIEGHFGSKASLLVEAVGREAQDFVALVLRSLTDGSPSSAVLTRLIVELQAGPALPMHQLLAETLAVAIRDAEVRRELDPHLRYLSSAISVVIHQAQGDGLITDDVDVDATVWACLTLMFGSCLAKSLEMEQPEPEQSQTVIMKFVQGLANGGSGATIDLREATLWDVPIFSRAFARRPPHGR